MKRRVLVTGAEGFVGRHLLTQLGDAGLAADCDVTEPAEVARVVQSADPDAIVHLAARSSVRDSWTDAMDVWRVNVLGTVNTLTAVREHAPAARVLIVSTGEVYGGSGAGPVAEDQPLAPLSPYAASKAAAEVAALRASRADGLDVIVARPFPHIGPGQDDRFAVGSWVRQIAELETAGGGTLLVGDLDVERDFTDVRDVCRAYRLLLEGAEPTVYNVASGRAVELRSVVEALTRLARCEVTVKPDPARFRAVDVRKLVGDATRLERASGWRPQIPLEQSLADALDRAREVTRV